MSSEMAFLISGTNIRSSSDDSTQNVTLMSDGIHNSPPKSKDVDIFIYKIILNVERRADSNRRLICLTDRSTN